MNVNERIFGMLRVTFFMNIGFLLIGLFGVVNETSYTIVTISNIVILGSIWILKKNEHLINGVIATNKLAKEVNKLIK